MKVDRILDGLKSKMDKLGARKIYYLREGGHGHGQRKFPATFV